MKCPHCKGGFSYASWVQRVSDPPEGAGGLDPAVIVAARRARDAEDEARIRDAIGGWVADGLGEYIGAKHDATAHPPGGAIVVTYRKPRGGQRTTTLPMNWVAGKFRVTFMRQGIDLRPRLSSIEVRDGDKWRTLRTFDADGNVAQQSPEAE